MRDLKFILQTKYETSRALVIGIDKYEKASPLDYAVSDAKEIRETLTQELGFDEDNITYLVDREATKSNILKSFMRFSKDDVKVDDRLFVFFAGHGHTKAGVRGDVGYLVPHDADMEDYSTFIRWDELTRNAELIRAKHILFVMDACYGGLAVYRDLKPGSSRFLKDMYQRFSRQVITAGKANEVVADSGGPLPNHSVFTGYLIEGLRGKASNEHGVITANGLMSYVYSKVSNDINSDQTPHYGQFDGDGDFIISVPQNETSQDDGKTGTDDLIRIPYMDQTRDSESTEDKIEYVKELLSSERSQIKLHDFSIEEVRRYLSSTSEDNFAFNRHFSNEELLERVDLYEKSTKDLSVIVACLAHWANENQLNSLIKIMTRSCDRLLESQGGQTVWLNLRWYPLLILTYSAGIAAIESKNYKSLAEVFNINLEGTDHDHRGSFFIQKVASAASDLVGVFKQIPEYERKYTPLSEYLFKILQPDLDDLFFLSTGYEPLFDEFEILFALVTADLQEQRIGRVYGPIGRFGWKGTRGGGDSPFQKLLNEANLHQEKWGPIQAGMFGGSYERFKKISNSYKTEILDHLGWF
ncbi:caspase family protein [Vibrio splendidus]|uniref:caspase family protein n=1 Tax=Vibrio splendidus TaxID=29497 RepID=UPI000D389BB8|nr:caspase family protein [Vibrio splendidus]PTO71492.1 peptidase C14 caspase catalytic subunit p20 [Vibrio splendidus]